jgi:cytochrome c oxidase subunit 4
VSTTDTTDSTDTGDAGHFGHQDPAAPSAGGGDDGRNMGHLDEDHTHGPTDGQYFLIFWILVAITALEVSTYFWESWFGETDTVRRIGVAVLLTLMVVKFVLIAGYFMHLKFDSDLLRRTFLFGLIIAVAVYTVALSVMNIWTDNGNPFFDDPPPAPSVTVPEDEGA